MFVNKKFVNEGLITKITKILCHENLELYGIWIYAYLERGGRVRSGRSGAQGCSIKHDLFNQSSKFKVHVLFAPYEAYKMQLQKCTCKHNAKTMHN